MAITYVGGKTATDISGAAWSTSLVLTGGSDAAPQDGDVVVVAYGVSSNVDRVIGVTTAGYTEIAELFANDSYDTNLSVSWKRMTSTPDTDVTLSGSGSSPYTNAVAIHVWRGVNATTPLDLTSTTSVITNTILVNPPSRTPFTKGAVILAAGAGAHFDGSQTFGASDLTNFISAGADGSYDVTIGLGSANWADGPFDPPAWTFSSTDNVAYSYAAVTMVLRPATPATTTTVFLTSGTTWTVPADWNSAANSVQVIGAGGSGAATKPTSGIRYATGGGAGGYSLTPNLTFTPGDVITYDIGAGGAAVTRTTVGLSNGNAGGPTWFGAATQAASLCAANGGGGGISAVSGTAAGGAGATTTGAIGTSRRIGGAGGAQTVANAVIAFSSGGGGAGGPTGGGGSGVSGSTDTGTNGGTGGAGFGGSAGLGQTGSSPLGSAGGDGDDISEIPLYGSGGGGGGYRTPDAAGDYVGFSGGNYGGGGGGITNQGGTSITSGAGGDGLIVITYVPAYVPPTAVDIVAGAAVIGDGTLAQVHTLGATDVTSAAAVSTSTLVQVFTLDASALTGAAPVLGAAAVAQTHVLVSTDLGATATVGVPQIGQGHVLTPVGVTAGAAIVSASEIAQVHTLNAAQLAAGTPVVTTVIMRQTSNLAATPLTGAAITFLPPGPRLRNLWALTAANIVAGQPLTQSVALVQFYAARRRYVSVTLAADIQPVREWGTEVDVMSSTNTVVIEVDETIVEVYSGANAAAADNANSATGAYIGQTKAE